MDFQILPSVPKAAFSLYKMAPRISGRLPGMIEAVLCFSGNMSLMFVILSHVSANSTGWVFFFVLALAISALVVSVRVPWFHIVGAFCIWLCIPCSLNRACDEGFQWYW